MAASVAVLQLILMAYLYFRGEAGSGAQAFLTPYIGFWAIAIFAGVLAAMIPAWPASGSIFAGTLGSVLGFFAAYLVIKLMAGIFPLPAGLVSAVQIVISTIGSAVGFAAGFEFASKRRKKPAPQLEPATLQ